MSSWRESASPECQADMDNLFAKALSFTKEMLAKRGEYYPVVVPYQKARFGKKISYGAPEALAGDRHIWPAA